MDDGDANVVRPYYHHAVICGRKMTFANVEYATDDPPDEIRFDGLVWRLEGEQDGV